MDLSIPEFPLDIDLEYMQVVCAPFGGPIAMIRDPLQTVPMKGSIKFSIRIFNTAGEELSTIWVCCYFYMKLLIYVTLFAYIVETWETYDHGLVGHRGIDMCTGRCNGLYL